MFVRCFQKCTFFARRSYSFKKCAFKVFAIGKILSKFECHVPQFSMFCFCGSLQQQYLIDRKDNFIIVKKKHFLDHENFKFIFVAVPEDIVTGKLKSWIQT